MPFPYIKNVLLPLALQPTVGFGLPNNVFSIFSYLPPTLSIFSLPALEDLFLLPLSIFSWVFSFFPSLPVLEWRSFWAQQSSHGEIRPLLFYTELSDEWVSDGRLNKYVKSGHFLHCQIEGTYLLVTARAPPSLTIDARLRKDVRDLCFPERWYKGYETRLHLQSSHVTGLFSAASPQHSFSRGSTSIVLRQGLLCEVPMSHSDKSNSVGLLWPSERHVANTSTW